MPPAPPRHRSFPRAHGDCPQCRAAPRIAPLPVVSGRRPGGHLPPGPHAAHRFLPDRHLHRQRRPPPARAGPVLDAERPPSARRLLRRARPHHAQRGPHPPQRLPAAVGGQPGVPQPRRRHPGRLLPLRRMYVGRIHPSIHPSPPWCRCPSSQRCRPTAARRFWHLALKLQLSESIIVKILSRAILGMILRSKNTEAELGTERLFSIIYLFRLLFPKENSSVAQRRLRSSSRSVGLSVAPSPIGFGSQTQRAAPFGCCSRSPFMSRCPFVLFQCPQKNQSTSPAGPRT